MKRGTAEQQQAHAVILAALTSPKTERRERLLAIGPLIGEYLGMCRREWEEAERGSK